MSSHSRSWGVSNNIRWFISLLAVLSLFAAACGSENPDTPSAGETSGESDSDGGEGTPDGGDGDATEGEAAEGEAAEGEGTEGEGTASEPAEDVDVAEDLKPEDPEALAEWEAAVAAAEEERLVVLTRQGSAYQGIINDFSEAFPNINVVHTGARPSDIAPRVLAEQEQGLFLNDVMLAPARNMTNTLEPAGVFQDIRPFFLLPDSIADENWHGESFELYGSGEPYIHIHNIRTAQDVWINRDLVPESDLNDIRDLAKPEFKGKIAIIDCTRDAGGSSTLAGIWGALGPEEGEEFLRTILFDQEPVFQNTPRVLAEWVAEGRYPISLGSDTAAIVDLQDAGIGGEMEELEFGSTKNTFEGVAVFTDAPNPNAATVFLNWWWSKHGQESWITHFEYPRTQNTRRSDIPVQDTAQMPDYDNVEQYYQDRLPSGETYTEAVISLCQEAQG